MSIIDTTAFIAKAFDVGLDDEQKLVRAAQALAILEELEKLPVGAAFSAYREAGKGIAWSVKMNHEPPQRGESLADALGQMTTVLALEGAGR